MPDRADAHAHLFRSGYVGELPETCRRAEPSELTLYEAMREKHSIRSLLAIGYEGAPFAAGNSQYISQLAATRPWIRPTAYVHDRARLDLNALQRWSENRFVGLSFYLLNEADAASLKSVPSDVWAWLEEHNWLISVNSKGALWSAWAPILERFGNLRMLVSHLGLPLAVNAAPSMQVARERLADILLLAKYPGIRLKLSGLYALTQPGHAYPHLAAWPYVEAVVESFGSGRLVWGSDFSPSLEYLSFQQTYSLFDEMPFLSDSDREKIVGGNLIGLLGSIR
jgi:L-fuconolactonase